MTLRSNLGLFWNDKNYFMLPTTLCIQHIHICSTALSVQKSSKRLVQFLLLVSHHFTICLYPTTRMYISYSLKASGDDIEYDLVYPLEFYLEKASA